MSAKDIVVKPIQAAIANDFVRKNHYSGKVVPNSQVHLGVFYAGNLEGVMQFGPSLDKKKTQTLVSGTAWNAFIELNRMAFSEALPKNSESRAIGVALRHIRKNAKHIDWVISFADASQCGDGTIYRASGFLLTGIKKNSGLRRNPLTGEVIQNMVAFHRGIEKEFRTWPKIDGFQLRYVYFINPEARKRLTVEEMPYSVIEEMGATMYRGQRPGSIVSDASNSLLEEGSANLTSGLEIGDA